MTIGLKLGTWLPIANRLEAAKEFARDVTSRRDVPTHVQALDEEGEPEVRLVRDAKGEPVKVGGELVYEPVMVPVRPDLRDVQGRWWGTKEGKPIAGLVLITDLLQGSQSAIAPIVMSIITVLTVLASSFTSVGLAAAMGGSPKLAEWMIYGSFGIAGLIFLLFAALWSAIGAQGNRMVAAFAVLIPAIGLLLSNAAVITAGAGGAMAASGSVLGSLGRYALPAAALAFVAFIFIGRRDTTRQWMLGAFKGLVFIGVTATIAQLVLPGWLQPLYWAFLGCLVPILWNYKQEELRAIQLAIQSKFGVGELSKLGNSDPEKRMAQAVNAEREHHSGEIPMGRAKGILTTAGDAYSSDGGLELQLTCDNLRVHLHVFGKTGGGKSFNILGPVAQFWARHGYGGVLVLDGKGALGDELLARFIKNYGIQHRAILIKPGVKLGLMEGLSPHDFVAAISDVGGAKNTEEKKDDATEFFITQAKSLCLSLSIIQFVLKAYEIETGKNRTIFWHLENFDRLKVAMKTRTTNVVTPESSAEANSQVAKHGYAEAGGQARSNDKVTSSQGIIDLIKKLPAYADAGVQDAVRYIEHDFWTMPSDTAGSVVATMDNWVKPLLQHPELREWASTETGVDISIPATGGFVACSLPEVKYGAAGKLAQSLIGQRLTVRVRRRADFDWRAAGETPVLFVKDEAQELITQADRDFLPQARSLGGCAAYGTQSLDAYESRMGDASSRAFLDNFRSVISFTASPKTYEWMARNLGRGRFITWKKITQVIGFIGTAQLVAGSPLHDNEREDRRFMRKLRRRGGGKVIIPLGRANASKSVPLAGGGSMSMPDIEARMMSRSIHDPSDIPANVAESFTYQAVMSGEVKERDLLTLEDCAANLNSEQDAIVSLWRSGSPRHDFVRFDKLSPEQIAERENQFHRALIFNGLAFTLKRDLVDALGSRPKLPQLNRLLAVLVHLLLTDEAFAASYEANGLRAADLQRIEDVLAQRWVRDFTARQAFRAETAREREAFIDRYVADAEAERQLANAA